MGLRCAEPRSLVSSGINRFFILSSKSYRTPLIRGARVRSSIDSYRPTKRSSSTTARITRGSINESDEGVGALRNLLRTCYKKPAAFQNCGQCHKCRRTMMVLASLGAVDSFPAFPSVRSAYHFINCRWGSAHERLVGSQAITHSVKHRRFGLASAGFVAM